MTVTSWRKGSRRGPIFAIFLMGVSVLSTFSLSGQGLSQGEPGYFDLRAWDFQKDGPCRLDGYWMAFPYRLIPPLLFNDPEQSLLAEGRRFFVPGLWSEKNGFPRKYGNATYFLRVLLPEGHPDILSLNLGALPGAYSLYVNGIHRFSAGSLGQSAEDPAYVPRFAPNSVTFAADSRVLNLVLQVSNYSEPSSGFWHSAYLGDAVTLRDGDIARITSDIAVSAGLLVLGVYLLVFYTLRRREGSSLFLGIFSLLLGVRYLFAGNRAVYALFPNFDWSLATVVVFLCYYLSAPVFCTYTFRVFALKKPRWFNGMIYGIAGVFSLISIVFPLRDYAGLLPIYHGLNVIGLVYLFYVAFSARKSRPKIVWLFLASLLMLGFFVVYDIGAYYAVTSERNLSSPGLMFFLLFQAVLLGLRFNDDFKKSQGLSARLREALESQEKIKDELEQKVEARTLDLSRALEEARFANKAKNEFLANVSHEIRTPLNGILGFAELLQDKLEDPEADRYLSLIMGEAGRLLQLINQLLDFSKIEANKLVLENNPFDIHEMFRTVQASMHLRTRPVGLDFAIEIDERLPRYLRGDALRLRQILDNLLGNALKFTDRGVIGLRVTVEQFLEDRLLLTCSISDTGVGIPRELQSKIFESFQQADTSTTRIFGGTGLGTSISKFLVELMGGTIKLFSEPGFGSTFLFTAPLEYLRNQDNPPGHIEDVETEPHWENGPLCLVAEDYSVNAEITTRHLTNAGWRVRVVKNGQEALDAIEREPFDLVLLDIQMPVMDGLRACREMRLRVKRPLPILGLSANALNSDRQKCLEAGMNGLIPKPVKRSYLLRVLADHVPPGTYIESQAVFPSLLNRHFQEKKDQDLAVARANSEAREPQFSGPALLAELEGDLFAFLSLLHGFLDEAEKRLSELRRGLLAGELEPVHRNAHAIKGGAATIGVDDIRAYALALEKEAKAGRAEACQPHLEGLTEALGKLSAALRGNLLAREEKT